MSRHRIVIFATLLLLFAAGPAAAAVVNVPGGSVNGLQAAVDQAGEGGTVVLGRGTHLVSETVTISADRVRILANGGAVLRGQCEVAGGFLALFAVTGEDVSLKGLRAEAAGGNAGDLGLVVASGADKLVVRNCRLTGFVQLVNAGDSGAAEITKNRVQLVAPVATNGGAVNRFVIHAAGRGEVRVFKNRIEGPRASATAGISCEPPEGAFHDIQKNQVAGVSAGIRVDGLGDARISKNRVVRCENGMDLAETTTATGWLIFKNKIIDNLAAGIYLEDGDTCEIRKNDVRGAGTDGINVGGVFITLGKNRTRLNAGFGIFAASNSCNFFKNKMVRNGKGLRIEGSGNRLRRNRALRNIGDGIVATGGNANMGKNRGKRNGGVNVSIS